MKTSRSFKRISNLCSIGIVFILCTTVVSSAEQLSPTTLQILSTKGGFGKVVFEVKNTGSETAKNITLNISVKGGVFGRIDITKVCTGCSNCGPDILSNTTRTESTLEEGYIFGFGSVDIVVSSQAENAQKVTTTKKGFVLGFFVIVN